MTKIQNSLNLGEHYGLNPKCEFAIVENPIGIFPPKELYPLADKLDRISQVFALVMDMDGTTTSTETLCLLSLENMIRGICDDSFTEKWGGFKPDQHRYLIGNSTSKHIEYLWNTYREFIANKSLANRHLKAAIWSFANEKDQNRLNEIKTTLSALNPPLSPSKCDPNDNAQFSSYINLSPSLMISIMGDIYYQEYHALLEGIRQKNEQAKGQHELAKKKQKMELISPMPGVLLLIILVKGWINEELDLFYKLYASVNIQNRNTHLTKHEFTTLANQFANKSAKIALVTSSLFYEANIVLNSIFNSFKHSINQWGLSQKNESFLLDKFSRYTNIYDSVITADSSSEIRLKPHRDLYSLALREMHVPEERRSDIIGLEDSASGLVALRAAGIGMAVGVPFEHTMLHDLSTASHVLTYGLYELIDNKLYLG